jgi:hypothetical protein
MLNTTDLSLIVCVRAALAAPTDHDLTALGQALDGLLTRHTAHSAAVAAAAAARPKTSKRGAPALRYTVDVEPGPRSVVAGAASALAEVKQVLTQLGEQRRWLPSQAGFAAMLSKNGSWHTLVETVDGTVAITVTKQLPED